MENKKKIYKRLLHFAGGFIFGAILGLLYVFQIYSDNPKRHFFSVVLITLILLYILTKKNK